MNQEQTSVPQPPVAQTSVPTQTQPALTPPISTDPTAMNLEIQKEISKWNWGAFFLTWIWAIAHKVWWGLLALIPIGIVQLGIGIYLGVKGSELAWQAQKYQSIDEFKKIEHKWAVAGLVVFIIIFVLFNISLIILFNWINLQNLYFSPTKR